MPNIPAPEDLFALDDDRKARNERRARDQGLEPCMHCGRGVKPGKAFVVIVVGGGGSIAEPGSPEALDVKDTGYMGAWLLGSTCAKSIPASHRVVWNGW